MSIGAVDPAALITALAGLLAVGGGLWQAKRSRTETHRQQVAADGVKADRLRLEETEQAMAAMQRALDRADLEVERANERADKAAVRAEKADEARHREHDSAERARREVQELTLTLLSLRAVVVAEIVTESRKDAEPGSAGLDEELERLLDDDDKTPGTDEPFGP